MIDPTMALESAAALLAQVPAAASADAPVDVARAVYIFCMVGGFIWLVLSAFLGPLIGEIGQHDADVFGLDGDVHFSPMSPSVISAFTAAFGCGGLLSMGLFDLSSLQSLPIALAAGFAVAGFVYYIIRYIFVNVQGGVETPTSDLMGQSAEVIVGIPEGGVGEIAYVTASGRQTSSARAEDGKPVPSHSLVEIVGFAGPNKIVRVKTRAPAGAPGGVPDTATSLETTADDSGEDKPAQE